MLTEEISVSDIDCVCFKGTSDAFACKNCDQKTYNFCGFANKDDEMDILCTICFKTENAVESKINQPGNTSQKKNSEFFFLTPFLGITKRVLLPTRGEVIAQ